MCIAIAKPEGVKITKRILKECFRNNPDGAGFAYACPSEGKVKIVKGMFTFRSFWREYRQINPEDKTVLIHFRVATSGKTDSRNCHPWFIDDKHVLIHNGVLTSRFKLESETTSDTGLFAFNILKPIFQLSVKLWKLEGFEWLLEESIGTGNKMVIMNSSGDFKIFNEFMGEWEYGVWFSNKTYKEERKKKSTNSSVYHPSHPYFSSYEDRTKESNHLPDQPVQSCLLLQDQSTATKDLPETVVDIGFMY